MSNTENKEKLALVLAGGGSLGAYETGAIEALNELGFKFDIITGTSIGALNAAYLAAGQFELMKDVWLKISAGSIYKGGLSFSKETLLKNKYHYTLKDCQKLEYSYIKNGFSFDISPFKKLVKDTFDVKAFKESNIRCGVVTTKLPSFSEVDVILNDLDDDLILPYLHASSAFVPFFPIEKIDKVRYIDGFVSDNLPIKLAFKMGANKVIAIDLLCFQLSKEHKMYLNTTNVDYIAPLTVLGSPLNFEQSGIRVNIKRGYFDVMKYYGKYKGFYYTFDNTTYPSQNFFNILNECFRFDIAKIIDLVTKGIRKKQLNDDELFIRLLEVTLDELGVGDETILYSYDLVKQFVKNSVLTAMMDKKRDKLDHVVIRHLFRNRKFKLKYFLRKKITLFMIKTYLGDEKWINEK